MSGLDRETYYGKISKSAKMINKLDPGQISEGIKVVQMHFEKSMRDITNVHLKDGNLDIPEIRLKKKEPTEYVVEEAQEENDLER